MKKIKIFALTIILFMLFTNNVSAALVSYRKINITIKNINLQDTNISILFPIDYIKLILDKDNMSKYSVSEEKLADINEITKYVNEKNYLQALKIDNSGDVSISAIEGLDGKIDDNYFFYKNKEYIKMNVSDAMKDENYDKSRWPKNSFVIDKTINVNYDKTNIKVLIEDYKLNKETIINLDKYKYEKIENAYDSYIMNVNYTYSIKINTLIIIFLFVIILLLFFAYYYIKNYLGYKNKTKK